MGYCAFAWKKLFFSSKSTIAHEAFYSQQFYSLRRVLLYVRPVLQVMSADEAPSAAP
jgi:hypothetical protein